MVKFPLSPELSKAIASHSAFIAQHNALPLYEGWWETVGICPDGEIIEWCNDDGDDKAFKGTRPFSQQWLVLNAIVEGARKYPMLNELLPARPSNAVDCPCVEAFRDRPNFAPFCNVCGGLRWVSACRAEG